MKRIDFENDTVTKNIINAAFPLLVAQIMSLLYNVVDRIYIARIPSIWNIRIGCNWLMFSFNCDNKCIRKSIWQWRSSTILH